MIKSNQSLSSPAVESCAAATGHFIDRVESYLKNLEREPPEEIEVVVSRLLFSYLEASIDIRQLEGELATHQDLFARLPIVTVRVLEGRDMYFPEGEHMKFIDFRA